MSFDRVVFLQTKKHSENVLMFLKVSKQYKSGYYFIFICKLQVDFYVFFPFLGSFLNVRLVEKQGETAAALGKTLSQ